MTLIQLQAFPNVSLRHNEGFREDQMTDNVIEMAAVE